MPPTVACQDADTALTAFHDLGGDVVVKPLFGSEGRGMVRVADPDLAWRTFRTLERLDTVLYLQKFIAQSSWSDDPVVEELQRHVTEVLGDPDAALNVDETGFPKKGTKSVGVKRQYSGTMGRTDNCQVAVFANYASPKGHTFMDRRLFLPEEWVADSDRRQEAGVPADVIFRTKPALALEMVANAVAEGVPCGVCCPGNGSTG